MTSFSKGEAIRYGWEVMKQKFWFFLVIAIIVFAINIPFALISHQLQNNHSVIALVCDILVNIASVIISLWLSLGVVRICLNLYETKAATYADLFSCGGSLIWKYFLSSLLVSLMVLAGFILLSIPCICLALPQFINYLAQGGQFFYPSRFFILMVLAAFTLLSIFGIYLTLRLQFIGYLIVEDNLGPVAAIDRSWKITRGHVWNLFLLSLLLLLINLAGLICLVIGVLATYPATLMANTFVYKWLKQSYDSQQSPVIS
jgi:hypothetical protein